MKDPVTGRYVEMTVQGKHYRIYYESAGQGVPLVCLHTAGADSRQYQELLRNRELLSRFQVIAFDLPFHGRSMPPKEWWLEPYRLTTDLYVEFIMTFLQTADIEEPLMLGCSMGGNITLELAYRFPEKFRGVIALEAAAATGGRLNDYLFHPQINGGEMCATNVYGLMAPQSPEHLRRDVWWIYSQGAPGVYYGDISFYSEDWNATDRVGKIDTSQCPVFLFTGEYDYSCSPEMSRKTAALIPGAEFQVMNAMGHFPMSENPDLLMKYLRPVLDKLC
ncbi:alpha/beta fold hydrolase [Brevibacillus centrosporus]|uniref:Pimeloyl-ACP methyl ester carboxylesterase n=1 Tax=Brevibacillus centrosporus TaxID=54910 RepID=A0A1I3QXV1_9BACL|nr:alpha/beta hydrolase [Brevibacillus centrosporus]SFJ38735.1 Pimeloyl-ACP methyl ester carboxylesterase [Brevibacillus centrosporus]